MGADSRPTRRRVLKQTGGLVAIGSLAGCGGNNENGNGSDGDGTGNGGDTADGSNGSVQSDGSAEITIVTVDTQDAAREANNQIASSFEEETGNTVEFIYAAGTESTKRITQMVRGGNAPELAMGAPTNITGPFLAEDRLASLADVRTDLEDGTVGEIPDSLVPPNSDGEAAAIPFLTKAWHTVLNTDLLEEAGMSPPSSVDERLEFDFETYQEYARAIDENTDANGAAFAYSDSSKSSQDAVHLLWGNGANVFGGSAPDDIEVILDQEPYRQRAIDAIDYWTSNVLPYAPDGANSTWADHNQGLAQATYGLGGYTAGSVATQIRNSDVSDDRIDAVMGLPNPKMNGEGRDDGKIIRSPPIGFNLFKDAENTEVAKEYIKHFFQGDGFWTYINARPLHQLPPTAEMMESDQFQSTWFAERRPDELKFIQRVFEEDLLVSPTLDPRLGGFNGAFASLWAQGQLSTMMQRVILQDQEPGASIDEFASAVRELDAVQQG